MKARDFIRQLQMEARERGRPVMVRFITGHCGWYSCHGYHPQEAIVAFSDGRFGHIQSPYGVHSLISPPPQLRVISEREAVRKAAQLMARMRRAMRHPFLSWKEVLQGEEWL